MLNGVGKYDDILTIARNSANAGGGILIIINGKKGSGLSIQAEPALLKSVPDILEQVADELRRDLSKCTIDI